MKQFIGTKIIKAELMTRNEFAQFKGQERESGEDMAGYKVVYPDGYVSWSPQEVFEEAYRLMDGDMNFGLAIEAMKKGKKVTRLHWNAPNQFLKLQTPDANSKMNLPYIYISTVSGQLVPWLASQTDMLEDDWMIVE